jgi:aryl-alcohol dehydrogenase-like predicted oxidoreductase
VHWAQCFEGCERRRIPVIVHSTLFFSKSKKMKTRQLGPFSVKSIGLGCMNLSHAYGTPPTPENAAKVVHRALDLGVDLFDTAALYGFGANETLLGPLLKSVRHHITLCSKGGMAGVAYPDGVKRVIDGRPQSIRANCEDSLRRLNTEVIDLYYLHRWDKKIPIEDSVGALSDLVREGKVRTIGLSEVSSQTILKAHAVHPITAVQTEYSLWTRNPEISVLKTCAQIGATFVAFSPVARGFLCSAELDINQFTEKDIRRAMPRFDSMNFSQNQKLLPDYLKIAREVGCTPAQLALAWLLHKEPNLLVIPGTQNPDHLEENMRAMDVALTPKVMQDLQSLINENTVHGPRYNAQGTSEVDTEEFTH